MSDADQEKQRIEKKTTTWGKNYGITALGAGLCHFFLFCRRKKNHRCATKVSLINILTLWLCETNVTNIR